MPPDVYLSKPFVAWDGEGVSREDGTHDYILFASSKGDYLSTTDHLTTEEIFEFILTHALKTDINVIFGAGYDWNMWLKDVPEIQLRKLYEGHTAFFEGYAMRWLPGKHFMLARRAQKMTFITFWDVLPFFQCSFVKACDSYLGDDFYRRDMVADNKLLRHDFSTDDLENIIEYNKAELINLVKLATELRLRILRAGMRVSRWDGPGALAAAQMRAHKVKDHIHQPPSSIQQEVMKAYFGGRFEMVRWGHSSLPVYAYDINSAYPDAIRRLPSLTGAWEEIEIPREILPDDLCLMSYCGRSGIPLHPLPWRSRAQSVAFPRENVGAWWGHEALLARDFVEQHGGSLDIHRVYRMVGAEDVRPFAFVTDIYDERRRLKDAGDGAHIALKLALNSMYGKTAQQVGFRIEKDGSIRLPTYHSLVWAGMITSATRAKLLRSVMNDLDSVVAFETDAVFSTRELDLPINGELGSWDRTEFSDITYVQSGMYGGRLDDGTEVLKTRGIDRGTISRSILDAAVREGVDFLDAEQTRFITLGQALNGQMHLWTNWVTAPRKIDLNGNGKRFHQPESHSCTAASKGGMLHPTLIDPMAGGLSHAFDVSWENDEVAAMKLADREVMDNL